MVLLIVAGILGLTFLTINLVKIKKWVAPVTELNRDWQIPYLPERVPWMAAHLLQQQHHQQLPEPPGPTRLPAIQAGTHYSDRALHDAGIHAPVASKIEQYLTQQGDDEICASALDVGERYHHVVVRQDGGFLHLLNPTLLLSNATADGRPQTMHVRTVSENISHCKVQQIVQSQRSTHIIAQFHDRTAYNLLSFHNNDAYCLQHYDDVFFGRIGCP